MFKSVTSLETGQEAVVEMTPEEVAELEATNTVHLASLTYAQKRQAEYPPITEYVDGVVKGDQEQITKYIASCLAVKAKYPKD